MKIEIRIDADCREPELIIATDKMTEEVKALADRLSAEAPQIITGFKDDAAEILEQCDIFTYLCRGRHSAGGRRQGDAG